MRFERGSYEHVHFLFAKGLSFLLLVDAKTTVHEEGAT